MQIVILSDVHDNITNLDTCLEWCRKKGVEEIICCGDLTNSQTLKRLSSFSGIIHLVKGNAEIYDVLEIDLYKNIKFYAKVGVIEIEGIVVGMCHEPYLFDRLLKKRVNIIFYGHTHKPWIEEKNKVKYINPGTLSGMFSSATFAFWDTTKKELQLKRVSEV